MCYIINFDLIKQDKIAFTSYVLKFYIANLCLTLLTTYLVVASQYLLIMLKRMAERVYYVC